MLTLAVQNDQERQYEDILAGLRGSLLHPNSGRMGLQRLSPMRGMATALHEVRPTNTLRQVNCTIANVVESPCSALDIDCICVQTELFDIIANCVIKECTVKEALSESAPVYSLSYL